MQTPAFPSLQSQDSRAFTHSGSQRNCYHLPKRLLPKPPNRRSGAQPLFFSSILWMLLAMVLYGVYIPWLPAHSLTQRDLPHAQPPVWHEPSAAWSPPQFFQPDPPGVLPPPSCTCIYHSSAVASNTDARRNPHQPLDSAFTCSSSFCLGLSSSTLAAEATCKDPLHRRRRGFGILWIAAALSPSPSSYSAQMGRESATQYLAGYAIEESLSIDNLFVFLILFRVMNCIEPGRQPRVLFWGVAGAIVMRGAFITAGSRLSLPARRSGSGATVFAAILLIAAIRLVLPSAQKAETTAQLDQMDLLASTPSACVRISFSCAKMEPPHGHRSLLALIAIELDRRRLRARLDPRRPLHHSQPLPGLHLEHHGSCHGPPLALLPPRAPAQQASLPPLRFVTWPPSSPFAALKMLAAHWLEIGPITSLIRYRRTGSSPSRSCCPSSS